MTPPAPLHPALAAALAERGYDRLTPVQEAMRDPALAGADALVSAQTGSGKTVAFGLALAPGLLGEEPAFGPAGAPLALIVAPTRELALQVRREIEWLYARAGSSVASCVGGMDYRTERRALERGAHLVIGTPGRLRDHIERGALDLSGLRAVVLDEADEMLDLGFREDLEFILASAPAERRTLMFSATVSKPIATLAATYQRDAVRIGVQAETRQHVDIDYRAVLVADGDRDHAVLNLLRWHEAPTALVFCATRAAVTHLAARLANRGFPVVSLSGELSQAERSHALQAMRDGRARVCIATDVAARGIDLPGLDLVIHADLPTNKETLLHRSGRTGRAGRKGLSALVVPARDRAKAERLLRFAGLAATWEPAPAAEAILARDEERLLADPALVEPATPDEAALAARLLATHGPERVAAALARMFRAGRSAPEDLEELSEAGRGRAEGAFADAVWFELSVGRDRNADPRWLLPMLCRAGEVTRRDIGAIRLGAARSHVQIRAAAADAFEAALGPEGLLEQGITARRAGAAPEGAAARPERGRGPAQRHGKPHKAAGPRPAPARRAPEETEAATAPKPHRKGKPEAGAPARKPAGPKPARPSGKPGRKPGGKPGGRPGGTGAPRRGGQR